MVQRCNLRTACRIVGSSISLIGIWSDTKQLEDAPHNLLGGVGFLIDSKSSGKWVTGGPAQFAGEVVGDMGLGRQRLSDIIENPKGATFTQSLTRWNDITKPYRMTLQELLRTPMTISL